MTFDIAVYEGDGFRFDMIKIMMRDALVADTCAD